MNHHELAILSRKACLEHTFRAKELEVLVRQKDAVVYVALRGTEAWSKDAIFEGGGWKDIIRDIRVIPWYDKNLGWCHAGFLKGAKAVVGELFLREGSKVVITGHSLGAGVGQLVAIMLHNKGYDVKEFVGFGMPRCFIGKRKFPVEITHYRYKDDLVSNVPHRWFLRYRHTVKWTQVEETTGEDELDDHAIHYYCDSKEIPHEE